MAEAFNHVRRIARKEFRGFFASPAAFLFLGAFLAVTLFVFFWVETFFARNLADLRPLFQWMPVLLIFLVAALTMRSWSEERRAGTLESLLTSPVSPLQLILGKFLAALGLVAMALLLTLPLPITVSLLGPLDWGPVIGGYVATLFLAAAYVAIGLYMSARTDNPIVALILTSVVCGFFYLLGSPLFANLFGHQVSEVLSLLGSGSRFESITRGVLDLRDLYYYLAIVGVFLSLNLYTLERLRWAGNPPSPRHRRWGLLVGLLIANFVAAGFWLQPIGWARADITRGHLYSLSDATENYLHQLQEPLLIRGYFTAQTHPLLAPLVPQIKDLLKEYAVAGKGRVNVEFVDPHQDQALEEEAASKYGIHPVPFQMADKYQASVVNSYFDILVSYGDQYEVLSFRDLIDIKARTDEDIDVLLKDPEYAITQAIRKVLMAYQAGGNPFDNFAQPVIFHAYVSPAPRLPNKLAALRKDLQAVLKELKQHAGDKLEVRFEDPDANGGALGRELNKRYGFGPQVASLLDPTPFWFYMMLESGGERVQVPLPDTLDKGTLRRSIQAALQRLAPGFLKTVAIFKPDVMRPDPQGNKQYQRLVQLLEQNARIKETGLKEGRAPADADLLLVLAPANLDEKQVFAIDQFLMQGGSVVMAASPFEVEVGQSLKAKKQPTGLEEWLASQGVNIEQALVMDSRNTALPVPVTRFLGGIPVQEFRRLPYPFFPDLRGDAFNRSHPITANMQQLTLSWASPISLDETKTASRQVAALLHSSPQSWATKSTEIAPDFQRHPKTGFGFEGEKGSKLLAVSMEGQFDSFFKGKEPPLTEQSDDEKDDAAPIAGVIEHSPDSARLVLVAAGSLAQDGVINLLSQGMGALYTRPLELLQNAVDWSLADRGLLEIRGRSQMAPLLKPLDQEAQMFWEYLNYGLGLLGLLLVWLWRRLVRRRDLRRYQAILAEV